MIIELFAWVLGPIIFALVFISVRAAITKEQARQKILLMSKMEIHRKCEEVRNSVASHFAFCDYDAIPASKDKSGTPTLATSCNGETITVTSDGIRIFSDRIRMAVQPSTQTESVIHAAHRKTNCPNCGAPLPYSNVCDHCGTHA